MRQGGSPRGYSDAAKGNISESNEPEMDSPQIRGRNSALDSPEILTPREKT
jgi:hypothetical protein